MEPQDDPAQNVAAQRRWRPPNKLIMSGLALLGVGGVAGGIAASATPASAATTTTSVSSNGTGPGGSSSSSNLLPGSGRQRPGATPGGSALALHGTVSAVGSSTVTIKTSSGTTTYAVTSSSTIEKGGKATTLSALAVGDTVAFSTTTSDGTTTIDRLIEGEAASDMAGGCGPGGSGPGGPRAGGEAPPGGTDGKR